MSADPKDVDAYFARIGYSGPRSPALDTLRAIVAGHTTAIPFENLDVLLKRAIRLDLPSIQQKLLHRQRGGYCFEHNILLMNALRALGFDVLGLAARVRWGRPKNVVGPRTHMLLRVDLLEGPYIADVGFGGLTPTAPLALEPSCEQPTPHETFRLVLAGDQFELEVRLGEEWSSLYGFSLQEQAPVDYEVANWFTSTHPDSLFVRHLIVTRPGAKSRYTLFDNRFTVRDLDGTGDRRLVGGCDELAELLSRYFGIALANSVELAAVADLVDRRAAEAHPNPFDPVTADPGLA
jgi:N-hydroxyarylamine O-acetyltransferase